MVAADAVPRGCVEVTLPARMSSLPAFQAALDEVCAHALASREVLDDLRVVVDEACSNVIKHAYRGTGEGELRFETRYRLAPAPPAIEIVLTDRGTPFDPLSVAPPDTTLAAEDRPMGGLGVHLIRQLTDEQHYQYDPEKGNRFTVVKRL